MIFYVFLNKECLNRMGSKRKMNKYQSQLAKLVFVKCWTWKRRSRIHFESPERVGYHFPFGTDQSSPRYWHSLNYWLIIADLTGHWMRPFLMRSWSFWLCRWISLKSWSIFTGRRMWCQVAFNWEVEWLFLGWRLKYEGLEMAGSEWIQLVCCLRVIKVWGFRASCFSVCAWLRAVTI